jgi:hypothetical protein
MTYRERKEAKAERLRAWAEKRNKAATATINTIADRYRDDTAFNTQPGHIQERARVIRMEDAAFESMRKADRMESRAEGIERQLESSIYSDDPNAIEALRKRIALLEEEAEMMVRGNSAWRKGKEDGLRSSGLPEKMILEGIQTMRVCPYLKAPYFTTNIRARIRKDKERMKQIEREAIHGKPWKYYIASKYPGTCIVCNQPVAVGSTIVYREGEIKHWTCAQK